MAIYRLSPLPLLTKGSDEEYPNAEIIGTDISPNMLPEAKDNPTPREKKVKYMYEDADQDDWDLGKFDYIHTRIMMGSFRDFKSIIKKAESSVHGSRSTSSCDLLPYHIGSLASRPMQKRSSLSEMVALPATFSMSWEE